MKPKKLKPNEPSLRDKPSQNFLRAFEADFARYGVDVIQQLRGKSPEKYAEIAAKLIAAIEPRADGFEACKDMESIDPLWGHNRTKQHLEAMSALPPKADIDRHYGIVRLVP